MNCISNVDKKQTLIELVYVKVQQILITFMIDMIRSNIIFLQIQKKNNPISPTLNLIKENDLTKKRYYFGFMTENTSNSNNINSKGVIALLE